MKRPFKKERWKTIFIVVLFMVTILLLYFLWKDSMTGKIKLPIDILNQGEELSTPALDEMIRPSRIVVNFGGDSHTILSDEQVAQWEAISAAFSSFSRSGTIVFQEITKSQYNEAMKVRSLRAEFDYWLPFVKTLQGIGIAPGPDYSKIEAFSSIAYSVAVPDSVLIYDGKNKKYYRLISESDASGLGTIIDGIESVRFDSYFPLGIYLGIENETLMPIALKTNMRMLPSDSEIKYYEEDKIVDLAKTFFGEGFDFVRKITENNGTSIYMYGYGKKILIIQKNGAIEYKQEPADTTGSQPDFYGSLDTAMKFVSAHGGWESLGGSKLEPYLKDVRETTQSGVKGYQFDFGMKINGSTLYYTENDEMLSVTVVGSYVTNYKRELINIDNSTLEALAEKQLRDTVDPINILTENYKYIRDMLGRNGVSVAGATDAEIFENTAALIDAIKPGYVRITGSDAIEDGIYPAWIFSIGEANIYFNIYDGTVLGTSGIALGVS